MAKTVRGPAAFADEDRTETELTEYPSGELYLEDPERGHGRVGDPRHKSQYDNEFPPERAREGGMSGGEAPGTDVTADDGTPETLLSEEPAATPSAGYDEPADMQLTIVNESEIGGGSGLDEAELADEDPLDGRGRE